LLLTISKIVLAPLMVGIAARALWTPKPWILEGLLPLISMLIIAVVVGIIVAGSREQLQGSTGVFAVVVLHCSLGFALGTWGTRRMISAARQRTTIAIEVGMQNSGLAIALAMAHFGVVAAVPGAIFSVWQNLFGAAFAAYHRRKSQSAPADE
jgi:BASS family bile acid:Na+ symporter